MEMGYSDDMKEKPVEQQLGMLRSIKLLHRENIQKYLEDIQTTKITFIRMELLASCQVI